MFFPSNQDVGGGATLEPASPALLQTPGPGLSSPRPALASGSAKTPWAWRLLQTLEKTLQTTAVAAVDYVRSTPAIFFHDDVIKTNGGPWMQPALPVPLRMLGRRCLGGADSRQETPLPPML